MIQQSSGMSGVLALILARGGSKRLPGKNVRPFLGKPLIHWVISAAKTSTLVDRTLVSTDSEEIRFAAIESGADVPFLRPASLATDETASIEVIDHAISFLDDAQEIYQTLVLLQATSPLTQAKHINDALSLFAQVDANSLVSVVNNQKLTYSRVNAVLNGGMIEEVGPGIGRYSLNGAIYISDLESYRINRTLFPSKTYAYVMRQKESADIDTLEDFLEAEKKGIERINI